MPHDPNATRTQQPNPPTAAYDTALDAGLAAAFGPDATPGGWSQPPLLRDDPSEHAPLVQPSSAEMPRGAGSRYQLLGEIARGGMGVVLKGRDPDLGRDLAFKVLRQELSGKSAAEQRFVEEAQVGGQLQHPGIVPVYDIGRFGDGRPYFAMKLVKGRTLADLLAERTDPTVERGRYLRHFLQVCNTLAYAHSKGVLHRDMKPSNVMVGAFDEVLVMDWGLAKVLARGGVADEAKASRASEPAEVFTEIKTARFGSGSETEAGSVMGTPAFMPPEQAGGEIEKLDERADVFGLGAVLCVILTGKPPYVSDSGEALRLMAVRGQLDECYARLDACGADAELLAICKRSLSVNRDARPRDAAELAGAVSGYLTGVETRAHDAEIERERAEVRHAEERKRQKTRLTLGGVALFVLFAGAAAASWQWWQTEQEKAKTAAALAQLTEEQARTVAALNAMTDDGVERLLASQIEQGEDQKAFVRTVIALHEEVTRSKLDTPAGRAMRADGFARIGRLQRNVGDHTGALANFGASIDLYAGLHAEFPDDASFRLGLAVTRLDQGTVHAFLKQHADSEASARAARKLLIDLVAQDSTNATYRYHLARAHNNLGSAWRNTKRSDNWLAEMRTALAIAEQLVREQPLRLEYVRLLAVASGNHTSFIEVPFEERKRLLHAALTAVTVYRDKRPPTPELRSKEAQLRESIARMLFGTESSAKGIEEAQRAREVFQKLAADYPTNLDYAAQAAETSILLGTYLSSNRKVPEAYVAFLDGSNILAPLIAKYPQNENLQALCVQADLECARLDLKRSTWKLAQKRVLNAQSIVGPAIARGDKDGTWLKHRCRGEYLLGSALLGLDKPAEAEVQFRAAIAGYASMSEANRESTEVRNLRPRAHCDLGVSLSALKNDAAAVVEYREAIRLNPKEPAYGIRLGQALVRLGDNIGAIAAFEAVMANDPASIAAHFQLGLALKESKDLPGAIQAFRKAADLLPNHPGIRFELGLALRNRGDLPGAEAQFKKWVELAPNDPWSHGNYGVVQFMQKRYAEAAANYREAVRLGDTIYQLRWEYGMILRHNGEIAESLVHCRKAVELNKNDNRGKAHFELGLTLMAAKDYPGAVDALREANSRASNPQTRHNLAQSLCQIGYQAWRAGNLDRCIELHEEALLVDPQYANSHSGLAWMLATSPDAQHRDGRRAVRLATRACEIEKWKVASYLDTLAAAYAETGEYDKAVEYQGRAVASPGLEPNAAKGMRERLQLYEWKQPYREPTPARREVAPVPRETKP